LAEYGNMLSKLFHYISDLMCIKAQLQCSNSSCGTIHGLLEFR